MSWFKYEGPDPKCRDCDGSGLEESHHNGSLYDCSCIKKVWVEEGADPHLAVAALKAKQKDEKERRLVLADFAEQLGLSYEAERIREKA